MTRIEDDLARLQRLLEATRDLVWATGQTLLNEGEDFRLRNAELADAYFAITEVLHEAVEKYNKLRQDEVITRRVDGSKR
jgi:predicted P-loop ATPase